MRITIDPVDGDGNLRIILFAESASMSVSLHVDQADALAKALIDEGIAWRNLERTR